VRTNHPSHVVLFAVVAAAAMATAVATSALAACGHTTKPGTVTTVSGTPSTGASPSTAASPTASPSATATTQAIAVAAGPKADTLALVSAGGSKTVLVPGHGHILTDVQISPDGRFIAYTELTGKDRYALAPSRLMVYDVAAGTTAAVSFGALTPQAVGGHVWVSPTALVVVAFNATPKDVWTNGTLCRCDVVAGTAEALKDAGGGGLKGATPSASADGATLAFDSFSNYKPAKVDSSGVETAPATVVETLRVFDTAQGTLTTVASQKRILDVEGSPFGDASVSPDGTLIFTEQTGSDVGFEVTLYRTSGGKAMSRGSLVYPGGAAWNPGAAAQVAFAGSMYTADAAAASSGVLLWKSSSVGMKQILRTSRLVPIDVAWSPDGQWIAYTVGSPRHDYFTDDLWIVRADGTGGRRLMIDAGSPSWGRVVTP
jgi:hypothetical protein